MTGSSVKIRHTAPAGGDGFVCEVDGTPIGDVISIRWQAMVGELTTVEIERWAHESDIDLEGCDVRIVNRHPQPGLATLRRYAEENDDRLAEVIADALREAGVDG